jgi:acyl-CoA synthetase (AMP-forming)/AMP-acid ligase II
MRFALPDTVDISPSAVLGKRAPKRAKEGLVGGAVRRVGPTAIFFRGPGLRPLRDLIDNATFVQSEHQLRDGLVGAIVGEKPAHMTLVDVLRRHVEHHPSKPVFGMITEDRVWTYAELDRRARQIAVAADGRLMNARAIIHHSTPLEFAAAFFGCLYAGGVPVPIVPARSDRGLERIRAVEIDSQAALVLTELRLESCSTIPSIATDDHLVADADLWKPPPIDEGSIALLQYTSGSTSDPKGVVVTHAQLLHNQAMISAAFGHDENTRVASWLPLYHDMGLIGCMINPVFVGGTGWFMDPFRFVQRPFRWLDAIGRLAITTAGAPNFAYDLCCERVTAEERARLDLSSWSLAFCGAEPVRRATLERFAATFAECGFRRAALYPCYGLAEATLFVSGGDKGEGLVDGPSTVDCGHAWHGQEIAIVDAETTRRCENGVVGEIWISGQSVASGYWNKPDVTRERFRAQIDGDDRVYLRTGDLGFVQNQRLFITGRLKDLIIVEGRNHHPDDIEATVKASVSDVETFGCGVFAIEKEEAPDVIIVVEVRPRRVDAIAEKIFTSVLRAVSLDHGLLIAAVLLVERGAIPRTTSGKLRRFALREAYQNGALKIEHTRARRVAAEKRP